MTIAVVTLHQNAYGQKLKARQSNANSIILSVGVFRIKNAQYIKWPVTQMGIHYERGIIGHWHVGIGYSLWQTLEGLSNDPETKNRVSMSPTVLEHGALRYRSGYKMIDLYSLNRYKIYQNHHYLDAGIGLFYGWGKNTYLDYYIFVPGYNDVSIFTFDKETHYWGIGPIIRYEYRCLKERVNVGIVFHPRFYSNYSFTQFDYGLQAGINF